MEDIQIWQLARKICQEVWGLTRDEVFRNDPGLRRQMLNSSGSMMDNVAEGFERGSNAEFKVFLGYAKGSAGELRSQMLRCQDRGFVSAEDGTRICAQIVRFSKQCKALIRSLKGRDNRGFRN